MQITLLRIYSMLQKKNSVAELLKQSNMSDKTVNRPDLDYVQEDLEAFWHKQKHKWWNDEHK